MKQFFLYLVLLLSVTCPAWATDIVFPPDKEPALHFTTPEGWTSTADSIGNLLIKAPNASSALSVALPDSPDLESITIDDFRKAVMKAGNTTYSDKSEPITVSGLAGTVYYGTMNSNAVPLDVKMIVIRIDSSHIACVNLITRHGGAEADITAGEDVLSSLTISTK
jgi:hypothetical protein